MVEPNRFVVTGATGWVGRSVLHQLQQQIAAKQFNQQVLAFGRLENQIHSSAYADQDAITIPIHPLNRLPDMLEGMTNTAIIHTAFVTRDRIEQAGLANYIKLNTEISDLLSNALQRIRNGRVIVTSSGAAAAVAQSEPSPELLAENPYAVLKLEEERRLCAVAETQVLRIYALTGRFIRDPHVFAIGDFLQCVPGRKAIQVRAPFPVVRGYGHAGDIAKFAIAWLTSGQPAAAPLATISHQISLLGLATRITQLYDLPPVVCPLAMTGKPDIYTHSSEDYLMSLRQYGISPLPLDAQIDDTLTGIV